MQTYNLHKYLVHSLDYELMYSLNFDKKYCEVHGLYNQSFNIRLPSSIKILCKIDQNNLAIILYKLQVNCLVL